MTCEEAMVLMNGHLDHENTQQEEAQLREHLQQCEACRQLLHILEGNDEALQSLQEDAPADLCANVMASVRRESPQKRRTWKKWGGVAVAAALVLVVGLTALPRPQQQESAVMAVRSVEDAPAVYARSAGAGGQAAMGAIQKLAEERRASIAVTRENLTELENLEGESLPEHAVLYALQSAAAAEQLSDQYGLALYVSTAEPIRGYVLWIP